MTNFAVNNQETVKFTFDSPLESNFNAGLLADMFLQRTEIDPTVLSEFYFAFSRNNPRLQAADLMARETMKSLDNQVGPLKRLPRKSWLALYETERFKIEAIGQSWFESLREQMGATQEKSGIQPSRYHEWLEKYRLHHNVTNLFRFAECTVKQRGAS